MLFASFAIPWLRDCYDPHFSFDIDQLAPSHPPVLVRKAIHVCDIVPISIESTYSILLA